MKIGKTNTLEILKEVPFGLFLDGDSHGEILLPKRYVPETYAIGDKLDVFIYLDSEDQLIATTETPALQVGEYALLEVKQTTRFGAFMDWGLSKDLLVPFGEQSTPMQAGQHHVVYCYLDKSERIAGTTKLRRYLSEQNDLFEPRQAVELMIYAKTELGYKAIIDRSHLGLIHHADVFQPLSIGQVINGFIKAIRADGKIDLCLQRGDRHERATLTEQIVQYLQANNGTSELTDKSPPEAIYRQFKVSKGAYKKALGALYKQKRVQLSKEKVTLIK